MPSERAPSSGLTSAELPALPIDELLPKIVSAWSSASSLVIEAPPGAGKTTRVPLALAGGLGSPEVSAEKEVVVLEPRRLATRMAARRVASELGEEVGQRIGYQVRFEQKTSPSTRLRFVTPGVLLRQLLGDPHLCSVGTVVFDEFHERQLESDLLLALLRRLQRRERPDLRIVVMSATLDASPIAGFLGGSETPCPVLRSQGRSFDVDILHVDPTEWATTVRDSRPLGRYVARGLRELVADGLDGHVLVFLPGAAEIERAFAACAEFAEATGLERVRLHGDLPSEEQDRAVAPSPRGRRKVIFATNVAETSLTIDGVVAVIDSGLARIASHAPWSGLPMLREGRISRASCIQRAGRAGRTRPGRCLRLYAKHDFETRPEQTPPEIERLDLAGTVLLLAGLEGTGQAAPLDWLSPPPAAAWAAAKALLGRLGALEITRDSGEMKGLSTLGRRMLRFPLHPRLARLVCEAEARGVAEDGCAVSAWLSERRTGRGGPAQTASDPKAGRPHGRQGSQGKPGGDTGLDEAMLSEVTMDMLKREARYARAPGLANTVRVAEQLLRLCERTTSRQAVQAGSSDDLAIAILTAYPDRVGKRRSPDGSELLLCGGGAARLAQPQSVTGELLVAVEAEERRVPGKAGAEQLVYMASPLEAEWLAELYLGTPAMSFREGAVWNAEARRVEYSSELAYGELVLESRKRMLSPGASITPKEEASAAKALAEALSRQGLSAVWDTEALERWRLRLAFGRTIDPSIPDFDDDALDQVVESLCMGKYSFAALREYSLVDAAAGYIGGQAAAAIDRLAPERVEIGAGRKVRIAYHADRPPSIASRLQDFFGRTNGPMIGGGTRPLVLELLAPNNRPVQVTTDLAGFWDRHYPQLRKELGRRYPRHSWPEDPRTAAPPVAPKRR